MQSDTLPHCAEPSVNDMMDAEIHSSKGTKMTDRVILQREFSELMSGLHGSILKYATDRAEHHQCEVYLCVNNKSNCDKILERIFDKRVVNKLKSNQVISVNGRKLSLYSPLTLNKSYLPEAVYLLMFPSPELLKSVEYQASLNPVHEIIVFTESDGHTEATDNWVSEHEVRRLGTGKTA
ncbi:hypothetical protein [Pectobacterium carotovorum]|uniref:hypothetical protein n=2 Tax=Pectobacterium TaxID=122277 RepID=UPI00383AC818